MKDKLQSLFRFLPALLVFISLASCDEDEYYYPPVKLEFLTAQADADGSLKSVLTDEGEAFAVVEDATSTRVDANSFVRIVSNYGMERTADGAAGIKLYALLKATSPTPQPAEKFKDGIKQDPVEVLSMWMGLDYLNMIFAIKAQNERHSFHFVEDEVTTDEETGLREVHLSLYHDDGGDVQAYTKRAYLSIPLRQYAGEGITKVAVRFSLYNYSGKEVTYNFEYNPQ